MLKEKAGQRSGQEYCPGEAALWAGEGLLGTQLRERGVEESTVLGFETGRKFLTRDWNHREASAGCTGPEQCENMN